LGYFSIKHHINDWLFQNKIVLLNYGVVLAVRQMVDSAMTVVRALEQTSSQLYPADMREQARRLYLAHVTKVSARVV